MVDTDRIGSAQERGGADTGSYSAGAPDRPAYPTNDVEGRGYSGRNVYDEPRDRRTGDLLVEDSIVFLGILLGGAAGYIAATAIRKPDWSRRQTHRSSGRGGLGRYLGGQEHARASRPVEHDETTDLIASSKVEGTAVYDRQGDKLGEVYNFMVGKRSGRVAYAVMSFGGLLGLGQRYHPLPWSVLTYDTEKKGYVIDADKDRLMRAPSYAAGEEPFSRPEYGRQVREYWTWSSDLT